MSADPGRPDEDAAAPSPRVILIRAVQTPLGFFVLVVLVAESILGVLAGVTDGPDRTLSIQGILGALGVLTAVVTVLAVVRPEALFGKRPTPAPAPTVAPRTPSALQLRTRWRSMRVVDGEEIQAQWQITRQDGEDVEVTVTAKTGPYKRTKYTYRGTFRDRVLTLVYVAADPRLPDRGTLTLKLSAAGDVLDGYLAFYSTARDRVEACPYRCEATG